MGKQLQKDEKIHVTSNSEQAAVSNWTMAFLSAVALDPFILAQ